VTGLVERLDKAIGLARFDNVFIDEINDGHTSLR
jgi:hypothetical protein